MKQFKILLLVGLLAVFVGAPIASAAVLSYTTGLDVWLDAQDINGNSNAGLSDGDDVATWVNKGTTGVNDSVGIIAANSPNYGTLSSGTGPLGVDVVALNNARYQFGQEFQDSPDVAMYFRLWQGTNSSANGSILTDYGTVGSELRNLRVAGGSVGAYNRDANGDTVVVGHGANNLADQTWATIFFSFDSATGIATWGELGNTATAGPTAGYDSTTTFEGTFGGPVTLFSFHDGNNSHDFNGFVSEVLIYDHLLSPSDQALVEDYLATKVPEPASMMLLGFGGLAMLRRRK